MRNGMRGRMLGKEEKKKEQRSCQGEEECRFKKRAGVDSIFRPVTSFRMLWLKEGTTQIDARRKEVRM